MTTETRAQTKILIIDDDPMHRDIVRGIFDKDPYEFLEASNADEGLEKAVAHMPQLIVADMRMPRMSGLDFLKTARKNPDIQHIPIVISTGASSTHAGYECLSSGAAGYFEKPLPYAAFRRRVKEILGHALDP
jgi:CheY-like chemotaxis protein